MGHDVFISHSTKDKKFADAVCAALESNGVRCWVAPRDILPGSTWAASILQAIADSRLMVLVFSRSAQDSKHICREVERAVHHGIPIAPIRIEEVMPAEEMEYYLSSSHWMDAITTPFDQHLGQLAMTVRILLATMEGRSDGAATAKAPVPPSTPILPAARSPALPAATSVAPSQETPAVTAGSPAGLLRPARRWGAFAAWAFAIAILGAAVFFGLSGNWGRFFATTSAPSTAPPPSPAPVPTPTPPATSPAARPLVDPEHESRNAPGPRRQTRAAFLLSTAEANDSPELEKATVALAALDELIQEIEPSNVRARALRERLRGYRLTFKNSVGMRFVEIKAGTFTMSSPEGEPGRRTVGEMQHQVTLTKPFMMGVHEVTQQQWVAVTGENPSTYKGDDLPVEWVSWEESVSYAEKLSKKEGRTYRLPTEAEWEYACRAGTTTAYHTGTIISADQANIDGTIVPEGVSPGILRGKTTPVGSFAPNAWGLHDMHGNVWEWCSDWNVAFRPGDATDPAGPRMAADDKDAMKVLRGGAWNTNYRNCRSSVRGLNKPKAHYDCFGLRLVLELQ